MWNAGAVALTAVITIIAVHQATRWELIQSLWVRIGASMDSLTNELQRIDRIAFITWLLSLGIAPVLGWVLSGRALSPRRTMVHTAATLHPGQLGERLPNRALQRIRACHPKQLQPQN